MRRRGQGPWFRPNWMNLRLARSGAVVEVFNVVFDVYFGAIQYHHVKHDASVAL